MIASPGDLPQSRQAVYDAVGEWNEHNVGRWSTVLVPLRWETSAVPMLGGSAQSIIDSQLLDQADIVVAMFGSRLGTATPDEISGTVSEIKKAEIAGKAVHLYFSNAGHPADVDPEQLAALRKFKKTADTELGLNGSFETPDGLARLVVRAIEFDLEHTLKFSVNASQQVRQIPGAGVDLLAQPRQERVAESDSKGRLKSKTKRWVDVTNRGELDAEEVIVESASEGLILGGVSGPTTIVSGQVRRFDYFLTFGGDGHPAVRVRWREGDSEHEKIFDVG